MSRPGRGKVMDNESLKELLQSATLAHSSQDIATSPRQIGSNPFGPPLSDTLLASLLPMPKSINLSSEEKPPHGRVPLKIPISQKSRSESTHGLHLDAVTCETTNISQVKHASHSSQYGNLVAVTGHAIAYVLNDKKIRLIAQENAAMGLMEMHEASRLPIVDISWRGQNENFFDSAPGLRSHSSHTLASVSRGGEVRVGYVYANTSSSLVYDSICALTFPEISPARGLAWGELDGSSLLAVFGTGRDIFVISMQKSANKTFYVSTGIASIESVRFNKEGSILYVAGLDRIDAFSLAKLDDVLHTHSIPLASNARRVWLLSHLEGVIAVAILANMILLIQPLIGDLTEILIPTVLTGNISDLFCQLDNVTNILCVGSHSSNRLMFVNLMTLNSPVVSIGTWPNDENSISVFVSGQLHTVFANSGADSNSYMFLYAYHKDSVKMHRFKVLWDKAISVERPEMTSVASQDLLRPIRSSSTPAIGAVVGEEPTRVKSKGDTLFQSPVLQSSRSPMPLKMTNFPLRNEEKSISKQHRRQDLFTSDIEEQRRNDLLATSINTGEANDIIAKSVYDAVGREISKVLGETTPNIVQTITSHLEQAVNQKFDFTLKKFMSSSKAENITSSLELRLIPVITSIVQDIFKESIEKQLLPGLQAILTDLIRQLSGNISQAILDASLEHHKIIINELKDLRASIETLKLQTEGSPKTQELVQSITCELRQLLHPITASKVENVVTSSQEDIKVMINEGNPLKALIEVLERGNLQLLNWIMGILDISTLLNGMSTQVILSLIQQIGHDLGTLTETKLRWLEEIFTEFDARSIKDPQLSKTMSIVFEELFSNLRVLFAETSGSSPYYKQVKLVLRLVRSSMGA